MVPSCLLLVPLLLPLLMFCCFLGAQGTSKGRARGSREKSGRVPTEKAEEPRQKEEKQK